MHSHFMPITFWYLFSTWKKKCPDSTSRVTYSINQKQWDSSSGDHQYPYSQSAFQFQILNGQKDRAFVRIQATNNVEGVIDSGFQLVLLYLSQKRVNTQKNCLYESHVAREYFAFEWKVYLIFSLKIMVKTEFDVDHTDSNTITKHIRVSWLVSLSFSMFM